MELLQDLLFTASLSLLLAFLLSKLVHASRRKSPMESRLQSSTLPVHAVDTVSAVEQVREIAHLCEAGASEESAVADVDVDLVDQRTVNVETVGEGEGGEVGMKVEQVEEDWEGVERSEMEKAFGVALAFADSKVGVEALLKLSGVVQLELYGLRKIAMEGPCYEYQPMPLKVSARSRWHAWQKLGNLDQELAMEKYIAVLSEKVPWWMDTIARAGTANGSNSAAAEITELLITESSLERNKPQAEAERKPELN